MRELRFPDEWTVGVVETYDGRRLPATGRVEVADGEPVSLIVHPGPDSFSASRPEPLVDLRFVRDLPPDAVDAVTLERVEPRSVDELARLAPGLRRVYVSSAGLGDAVLPALARLRGLIYLQTWGNHFTDAGVQVLRALTDLRHLYLEERTLSLRAFSFARDLPHLERLGVLDVPLSAAELAELREMLPGVDVG